MDLDVSLVDLSWRPEAVLFDDCLDGCLRGWIMCLFSSSAGGLSESSLINPSNSPQASSVLSGEVNKVMVAPALSGELESSIMI